MRLARLTAAGGRIFILTYPSIITKTKKEAQKPHLSLSDIQGGLKARNPKQGIRMFRHGSRSFSPAVHGRLRDVRRESHRVIRSAANTAMSQTRTSFNAFPTISCFYTPQGGTEKSDSLSGVRY